MSIYMSFTDRCLAAMRHLDYSDELKLFVIKPPSLRSVPEPRKKFEELGGNEDMYYELKEIASEIAEQILEAYSSNEV